MITIASYLVGFRILVNISRPGHIALSRFSLINIIKLKLYKRTKNNNEKYTLITQQWKLILNIRFFTFSAKMIFL